MLVVYTPAARRSVGNIAGVIDLAIGETNNALSRSGIDGHLRLARSAQVAYDEGGTDCEVVLRRATNRADGHMDQVHAMRDAVNADLVALLVDSTVTGCAGAAWLMYQNSTSERTYGFSLTVAKWANAPSYTFTHEIGHNLGAGHDTYAPKSNGLFSYSHGYTSLSGRWFTVMAYNDECDDADVECSRILAFSNPTRGTGTAAADNARTLRQTAPTVASYYATPPPPPPPLGQPRAIKPQETANTGRPVFYWHAANSGRPVGGIVTDYLLVVAERDTGTVVYSRHVQPACLDTGATGCKYQWDKRLPLVRGGRYWWEVRARTRADLIVVGPYSERLHFRVKT